jgi:branched-chain amino acid aminotransferase
MKLVPSRSIWFNGELVPWDQAQIHVLSHAMHYASSVFEGIRVYATNRGPAVFGLDAHVDRLFHSCNIVRMPIPFEKARIRTAILETVRDNGHEACYIRPLVFRGYGALGVWPDENPVEVAIATFPWVRPDEKELFEKGIAAGVSSWRRMAPDTLPSMAKCAGNYVNSALVVAEARRHGYAEGIVLNVEGYVSEGSGQNLFLVHEGALWTPPISASILAGVTRACVIQLAREMGMTVREERLPREMLYMASEAFFSGTVAEVTPIKSIDGLAVGNGARGPLTKRIQDGFFALVRGSTPDPHGWLTPVRT